MEKIKVSNDVSWQMPVVIMGTMVDGAPNFSTVAWITRLGSEPATIGLCIDAAHYSTSGIIKNKAFSINFPSVNLAEKADFCGIYSGKNTNKSNLFNIFYGTDPNAPLIEECPLVLSCSVIETKDFDGDFFIRAEIKEAYANENVVKGNKVEFVKMEPIIYMDKKYYKTGELIGQAWHIGKKIKEDAE